VNPETTAVTDDAFSRELSGFVAGLRPEDIPEPVIAQARRSLLDTLGCGLFGSTLPWSGILRSTLGRVDEGRACGVWGVGQRLSAPHAALANGAAVHAFELDDLHKESILHAGSVATPAALAAAELLDGVTGARLLAGIIAGYEVGARAGMTVGTAHLLQGWHPTGTHGALAAAAAAAAVLGLDAGQVQHALGIAGSQSAGLMAAQYSSMVKRFHAGRAAQSGLYAALLAREGYTGITNLFESEYGGYCTTFSPSHDLSPLTDALGSRWEALRVGYKPYAANGSCHPAIEIIQEMLATEGVTAGDVQQVVVHASSATVAHVGWAYEPGSVTTAQMNLPYIVAVALTDGEVFVEQFMPARISDPGLVQLSRKVTVTADPDIDARGSSHRHATRIAVHLADGRVVTGEKLYARGSARAPLSDAEVRLKYHRLAGQVLPDRQVELIEQVVDEMTDLGSSAALSAALSAAP
jgi:aconitate decarboxylase